MSENDKFINQSPEIPEFIIESDEEEQIQQTDVKQVAVFQHRRWLRRILKALGILAAVILVLVGYRVWSYYYQIGVPISCTSSENIDKLKQPVGKEVAKVVMTSDSILGVAIDMYAIYGLHANLEMEEPDTADTSVFLYCRSADHKADGSYLGSLVINGEEKETDRSRLGYMAMANGRQVIGISRNDKVKRFVKDKKGSFFRQFILVSNGVKPYHFYLRGKVERRAIGRIGEQLYYVATRHPETLWDFADALCEYGFTDAIYITGGTDYGFYRSQEGIRHDIGSPDDYPHKKWKGIIPWLVFRK